jgi:hypothetical protein
MATVQNLNAPLRAAIPNNSSSLGKKYEMEQTNSERPPRLDDRFAVLKGEIIKPQDERAVTASYQRLKDALRRRRIVSTASSNQHSLKSNGPM